MKNFIFTIALCLAWSLSFAQNPKLAVVSFDNVSNNLDQTELTELLRIELAKHDKFQIVDRYETTDVLASNDVNASSCLSRSCLIEAGKFLSVDYVMAGSADKLGEELVLRLRMIEVSTGKMEKEVARSFLYIPEKISKMINIGVNDLVGAENDPVLLKSLTTKESYESAINNPEVPTLKLSGPRMGYTFFTGDAAKELRKARSEGGYDAYPAFFQVGYQFEKVYLNEGKVQALVEVIPLLSGLDQGLVIPSLTIMNGLRNNKTGLEFAIGPSINVVRETKKYELDGVWVRPEDRQNIDNLPLEYRSDSRGFARVKSYVVFAAGYSFKSGRLNIPVNAFFVPSSSGSRVGFSVGFNARN